MSERLIFPIMRAMAEVRRQRILAELAAGSISLTELAERSCIPGAELREDVAILKELQLLKVSDEASDPIVRLGPNATVNLTEDSVQFLFTSPENESIRLTRPRSFFAGL